MIFSGPLGLAVIAEEDHGDESPANAGLVVALLGLLDLLDEEHHKLLWRSQPSQLGRLFLVLTEVLARPAVPSEWVSLKLSLVNTIASTVQMVRFFLIDIIDHLHLELGTLVLLSIRFLAFKINL